MPGGSASFRNFSAVRQRRLGNRGFSTSAGLLKGLDLTQATGNGALQSGFVAGQPDEALRAGAIVNECGTEQCCLRMKLVRGQLRVTNAEDGDQFLVDPGLDREGAVETPLSDSDALDQAFFAFPDWTEPAVEIAQEGKKGFAILAGEQVLFGAQAVF